MKDAIKNLRLTAARYPGAMHQTVPIDELLIVLDLAERQLDTQPVKADLLELAEIGRLYLAYTTVPNGRAGEDCNALVKAADKYKERKKAEAEAAKPKGPYETFFDQTGRPNWVTRRKETGQYVAYHYIQEAADQLTAKLNAMEGKK